MIILVAVAVVILYAYQDVTADFVIERNRELTRLSAGQFAANLREYADLLDAEARKSDIYGDDPVAQRDALKGAQNRLAVFDAGVLILNTFGTVVAVEQPERPETLGQDWSDHTYYRAILRSEILGSPGPVFSDIVADGPGGAEVIVVAVPITGPQGEFVGTIAGMFRVGVTTVSAFYGDIVKLCLGESSSAYLVDGNGRVIYHTDTDRIADDFSAQAVVQPVLSGKVDAIRTRDFKGRDIVASFAPVPGTFWGLVTQESWAALTHSSRGYGQFLLLLLALGVVVPALVVAVGVRRITRPIAELIGAVQEVARGNFGQKITARTGDEVEELAEQFNLMSAQLQESYAHLEQRVAERTKELAALNAVAQTVSQSLELEAMLTTTLDKVLEVLEFESGAIYLKDLKASELLMACHRGLSDVFRRVAAKGIISARTAESSNPIIIDDLSKEPDAPKEVVEEGYRSVASIPLLSKGQVHGVLTTASRQLRRFRQEDVDLLLSIGHQIGVAIENARLFNAEQRRAEQFRVISEVGRRVTSILAVDELLDQMVGLIQEAFNYYLVEIGLVEEDEVVFKARAGRNWDPQFESFSLKVGKQGITGWVAAAGEPLLVPDVSQEPRYIKITDTEARSELAVPIKAKEKVTGVINVESDHLDAFDESDLAVLQSLAHQAAIAIENARLFEAERRMRQEATLLAEMAKLISGTLDLDEVLRLTAEYAVDVFDVHCCCIFLYDEGKGTLRSAAQIGFDDQVAAAIAGVEFTPSERVRRMVFEALQPLIIEDVPSDSHLSPQDLLDLQSALVVPIEVGGRRLGAMQLSTQRPRRRHFTAEEGELALALANQAAMAIDNARHHKAEQRRAEEFRVISEVGRRITSILAVDELLVQIVRLIQEAFNYYSVAIGLIEGDEVVYKVGAGLLWDDPQFQFKPARLKVGEEGITGWVADTGEPLLVPDVSQEPRYVWMQGSETRSELTVPVKAKGKVIGVLDVQSDQLDAFDESDLLVLQSLAHQAAIAIENARFLKAEQRRAEEFRVISEVGRRITSLLAVDELLDQMVRLIQEAFNYYYVGFGLIEGDELVSKAGAGPLWDAYQSLRLKVGQEGIGGWVAHSGEPLLVPDVSQEPRYYFVPQAIETRSELCVPLKTKEAVIGVLDVQSDRLNAFDESDLAVLQSLAHQAAIAIENARLYEQAQQAATLEERQRLARDLHDSVTQALYGVTLYAEAAARLLSSGEMGMAADHLRELRDSAQEALREMRLLIFELRPSALEKEGLAAALEARLEAVEGRAGLKTDFKVEGEGRLVPEIEEELYRIAQEALNNALKHAQARRITVSLRQDQRTVTLEITDDGIGFDPTTARDQGGLGLSGMEERAAQLGARLTVQSRPGEGTTIRVEVNR